jgi:signal transduction histidine kinase
MENLADLHRQQLDQALLDKAIAQGKYEISSDILHNIGNAIVGFGSYLTRIRRSLEQDPVADLTNLADFFARQRSAMTSAIGEAKANALVDMLNSIIEAQKNGHEEINRSVTEQLGIITHIQEILNIQRQYVAGQASGEKTHVNIKTVIEDCLAMLIPSMQKRSIKLSLDISTEIPRIKGDKTMLIQVMLNILKNSIEAIDINSKEKTISIGARLFDGELRLEISDSGCGFDELTKKRLFSRGFTTKPSGTGLGLSSCRTILEVHGGTIQIASNGPGKGSLTSISFKN